VEPAEVNEHEILAWIMSARLRVLNGTRSTCFGT
jgi:hypothetical protein